MEPLLFLGVGSIARAVRNACPGVLASGTTRRRSDARFTAMTPIAAQDDEAIRRAAHGARVLVSFPPDGSSDRAFSSLVADAASVAYLSSTAVYAASEPIVTEASPPASSGERASLRLTAEAEWLTAGASIVRLPAFYGPDSGLHLSLARGTFRLPGLGTNIVSRVHVDDAARFVLAAWSAPKGSLLLAGDDLPAKVIDVVTFVSSLFGLPMPASSAGEDIPLSLRGSRSVDNRNTRTRFGIPLRYPSYREGYRAIHALGARDF